MLAALLAPAVVDIREEDIFRPRWDIMGCWKSEFPSAKDVLDYGKNVYGL